MFTRLSNFDFNIDVSHQFSVESFYAEEGISRLFWLTANLVSEERIQCDDVIGKGAKFRIVGGGGDHFFNGIINDFSLCGDMGDYCNYQASLVPQIWLAGLNKDFRIFQNMNVVDIVTKVLKKNHILSDNYEFRLLLKYDNKRFCTQYGESDLDFLSRILAEEGIFYFFEHEDNGNKMIFADSYVAYKKIAGKSDICYHHDAGLVPGEEVIDGFSYNRSILPGKVTATNYNFKRPSLDLTVMEQADTFKDHEIFDYPADYGLPGKGKAKVRAHLQEQKKLEETAQGTCNCARFTPGFLFTAHGHPFDGLNRDYCLVTVTHSGAQPNVFAEYSGIGGDYSYSNSFLAVPSSVTFRPDSCAAKPLVNGLQSAIVTGPPGEAVHCDEYGRIKVQFHWDREGQNNEESSCWLRISQPWSGQGWGMISIPRVGDEVLVDFINGDPDWPIVVGSVNNAASPALYHLPANKSQIGIRTRSYPGGGIDNFHELRFEDKRGSEEIYLQSEKDLNILVKNDKGQTIGHDESLVVSNDRHKTVRNNQSERIGINKSVGGDHNELIGGNMSRSIGANKGETVGANAAESVALAKELTVGELYQVTVGGVMNETIAGAKTEEVGLAKATIVGADMTENIAGNRTITVGGHLEINATDSIQINCGESRLRMESDGSVYLNGTRFDFAASGIAKITAEDIQLN